MLYLSGLLLLLLDPTLICGQMTQDNRTAIEDESLRAKTENAQNESLNKDTNNGTVKNNVTESNETLPYIYGHCYEENLKFFGEWCSETFSFNMSALGKENWCNMEMVIRNYNQLTSCLEQCSTLSGCFYPNRVVEQMFIIIHQEYFSFCSSEEDIADAPAGVVLVATLLPILLIPFIVYMVVWKSSLRD